MLKRTILFLAAVTALSAGAFAADAPKPAHSFGTPLATWAGGECDAALDAAAASDGRQAAWIDATTRCDAAFQVMVAFGGPQDAEGFREATYARRLLKSMQDVMPDDRVDLLKYFHSHDAIAKLIAFNVQPGNFAAASFLLLDKLRKERPKQVDHLPNLAVAIAMVRARPLDEHINENDAKADDPLAVFDYYSSHESQMALGLSAMPVELLEYVVDTTASVDDMTWALQKYARTNDVGGLFFTIKYDYDAFLKGTPKKLDAAGFSLPNILKFGGVCVDQAYFAESVGKSIGIPTAIASAASAEVGHAWIGFLQVRGQAAEWNFSSGRYPEYQGIRGNVRDPQSRNGLADSTVTMTGDVIGTTDLQRQTAAAFTDAAAELVGIDLDAAERKAHKRRRGEDESSDDEQTTVTPTDITVPQWPESVEKPKTPRTARTREAAPALDLVELALRQYTSYIPAWRLVATLADDKKLNEDQEHRWADLILRKCGSHHPDFALEILDPMILAVAKPQAQSDLWDSAFALVSKRADLAASVRMHQAELWKKSNELAKAGRCYEDVLQHFLNAGPFALPALHGAEDVLMQMNQKDKVIDLYAMASKAVTPPGQMAAEFVRQSNWWHVREAYAKKLDEAGKTQEAEAVRQQDAKLGGAQSAAAG